MIEYLSLKKVTEQHLAEIQEAVARVTESGWYLQGAETKLFEQEWAHYCGCRHCIACGNGLDALTLILMAYKERGLLTEGDEVAVPANTYIASILAITRCGLTPLLIEPDINTLQIDGTRIEEALSPRTKALMIVHLYGRNAFSPLIGDICQQHNLLLIEDCAQAHGIEKLTDMSRPLPSDRHARAYSFYPGKNLGVLGDAGAVVCDDDETAALIRALGNYGSSKKYVFPYRGINSRMDEIQAAVLQVKMKYLDSDNARRRELALLYIDKVKNDCLTLPTQEYWQESVFHIFPVLTEYRDELQQYLHDNCIQTVIHYPIPPHKQECYSKGGQLKIPYPLPITEAIHQQELSIPLNQTMREEEAVKIISCLNNFKMDNG